MATEETPELFLQQDSTNNNTSLQSDEYQPQRTDRTIQKMDKWQGVNRWLINDGRLFGVNSSLVSLYCFMPIPFLK